MYNFFLISLDDLSFRSSGFCARLFFISYHVVILERKIQCFQPLTVYNAGVLIMQQTLDQ